MPIDLTKLTDKQKKRLGRIAKVVEQGNAAMLSHLFDIEEQLEETLAKVDSRVKEIETKALPKLQDVMEQIKGKNGLDGDTGEKGDKGEKGDAGEKGSDGKDGKNGLNGIDGKKGSDGKNGIDGQNGKDGSPDTGEQIIVKINSSEGLIDKERVEGFDKEIKRLDDKIDNKPTGGQGRGRKVPIIQKFNLTDQCNGTLKAFTLPMDTMDVLAVFGTQYPINFNPGVDWTFEGRTLTLGNDVSAPAINQTLYALIEVLFF